jgi:hypothetical protein
MHQFFFPLLVLSSPHDIARDAGLDISTQSLRPSTAVSLGVKSAPDGRLPVYLQDDVCVCVCVCV